MSSLEEINSIIGSIFNERVKSIVDKRKRNRREIKGRRSSAAQEDGRLKAKGMLTYPLPECSDPYIAELIELLGSIWMLFEQDQWQIGLYGEIDRALVHLSYVRQNHSAVQYLIGEMYKAGAIPKWMESELEDIWHFSIFASYIAKAKLANEGKQPTVASLTAVQKYRLRKRWPCPTEVNRDKRYKIGRREREILFATYNKSPRPNRLTKESLVMETGLQYSVITNWFKNSRQRSKSAKKHSQTVPNPITILSYQPGSSSGSYYMPIEYNQASGCQFGCCQPSGWQQSNSIYLAAGSYCQSSSSSGSSTSSGGGGGGSYPTSNHNQLLANTCSSTNNNNNNNNSSSNNNNIVQSMQTSNDYTAQTQWIDGDLNEVLELMFNEYQDSTAC